MQEDDFRNLCKIACYILILLLVIVLYKGYTCPSCKNEENFITEKEQQFDQFAL